MLPLAYYFLKVIICSGLLFGYYFFALRNKRFHQHNRFYLLSIALMSWFVPLFKIEFWNEAVPNETIPLRLLTAISSADAVVAKSATTATSINIEEIVTFFFVFISSVLLLSLCFSLYKIFKLIKTNHKEIWQNVTFIFIKNNQPPFSYFRYIFWNNDIALETPEGKSILQHELTHVHGLHSLDKLFINLLLVVGWFNPFFWLIKKELNMIHEFIADKKAIANGDVTAFAEMLLRSAYPQHSFALTNSFFHSPIKRRIMMLANLSRTKYSYLRRLLALPLVTMVIVLFAFKSKQQDNVQKQTASIESWQPVITELEQSSYAPHEQFGSTKTSVDISDTAQVEKVSENTLTDTGSAKKPMVVIDGKEPISWLEFEKLSINSEKIKSINVLKGQTATKKYGAKGANGIIEITTSTKESNSSEPEFEKVFTRVENLPYYEGGMVAFANYIESNMKYPKEGRENKVEGAVVIQFIVDENGGLSHFKALSSLGFGLEEEAIRLLKQSGDWHPGIQNGRKVPVRVEQQIIFKLSPPSAAKSERQSTLDNINLQWPVEKSSISVHYGKFTFPGTKMTGTSDGITFNTAPGTAVKAADDGIITSIFEIGEGKAVVIRHDGFFTTYSRLSKVSVKKGEKVSAGISLGTVATNNDGEGELLFLVTDLKGQHADPERFLTKL